MSTPAAIAGSYADFKIIKTRSVCQIVVELPIEQAEAAIHMLGIPLPGKEVAVAVALLKASVAEPVHREAESKSIEKSDRARIVYKSKTTMEQAAQRAAILCKDERFQAWLAQRITLHPRELSHADTNDSIGAKRLRKYLSVKSRSEIATDELAYQNFLSIEASYEIATGKRAEPR